MDSNILLDYALFQLTPTRTRCDLVVFYGGKNEKVASGLVEPFISHLKSAKDQILKGGYSITLRPPTPDAFWFTKHTFQRFVRFVSTPEILERFIQIEHEISQIATSIQSNEISNTNNTGHEEEDVDGATKNTTDSHKSIRKGEGVNGVAPEENSKSRLQRLLGTRKSLLLKEQAMAYARAKAAGFGIDRMDELIYFSDAFGASRLREACGNFRDLYKQKHSDSQWMDELAAMEAFPPNELSYMGSSGITLAFENNEANLNTNGVNSDVTDKDSVTLTPQKMQMNMPWPNQGPQYMHNYQIPMQQYSPYQSYPMPGMHPYFPGHMPYPNQDTTSYKSRKSLKKKGKHEDSEESEVSEEDDEQSESDSETVSEKSEKKIKKKKKNSKTVVIRNINYITSKRSESSSEESEDAIKKHVVDAVSSLEKKRNSKKNKKELDNADVSEGEQKNENWNTFQTLLMSREEDHIAINNSYNEGSNLITNGSIDIESEKGKVGNLISDASILSLRDGYDESRVNINEEKYPSMKIRNSDYVEVLPSQKVEGPGSNFNSIDFGAESALIRNGNREDWFVANRTENREFHESKHIYENNNLSSEREFSYMEGNNNNNNNNNNNSIDDSVMVQTQTRQAFDEFEWKRDLTMVADLKISSSPSVNGVQKDVNAPDDLCVVLVRDSIESSGSWTREMDYGAEILFTEPDKKLSIAETNEEIKAVESKKKTGPVKKVLRGSVPKVDSTVKSKKAFNPSRLMGPKNKFEKEDDIRKRMEESAIERQKRIAERTAASTARKVPIGARNVKKVAINSEKDGRTNLRKVV